MQRRGQVTIFIIIAVVIVAIATLALLLFRGERSEGYSIPEAGNIQKFVEDCIKNTGKEVVNQVIENGGHYLPPEQSTASGVPYYLYEGKNYFPSKGEIEKEISLFVGERLFFCTKNFVDFPEVEVDQGEINVKSKIEEEKVESAKAGDHIGIKVPERVRPNDKIYLLEE